MITRLTPLEPVELVSADEVHALIARADAEFAALEARAAEATAAADHAEARAQVLGASGVSTAHAMVSMRRFIDQWTADADAEAAAIVRAAREGARVRLGEARDEAERVRRVRGAVPQVAAVAEDVAEHESPPAVVAHASVTESIESIENIENIEIAENTANTANTAIGEVAAVQWAPPPADVSDAIFGPPPTHDQPRAGSHPFADVVHADDAQPSAPAAPAFWPEPAAPKRKGLLRRVPLSAVLEVAAVMLILVFILLRLS